jgi:preprotein translocase subunit SecF
MVIGRKLKLKRRNMRIKKHHLAWTLLVIIIVLAGISAYIYREPLREAIKFPVKKEASLIEVEKESITPALEVTEETPEKLEITEKEGKILEEKEKNFISATQGRVYEETAELGEGITHLARKALKHYLQEKGEDLDLTPEHKIFIEDYLQNKIGERWLQLGEKISFSEDLIKEAIDKALQLDESQLENLKQYSSLVPSLDY